MRSGSNEGRVGVGEGVGTTEPLVDAGDVVGEDVGEELDGAVAAPQAARAAALVISSAVRWIRIESFLSFLSSLGECLLNDHFFAWLRLTHLRCGYGDHENYFHGQVHPLPWRW